MISGAAFCPHPPVLVPAVASGAAPEMVPLRAACRAAITKVASRSDRLVLIGGGERTFTYSPSAVGSFAGFGVDLRVRLAGGVSTHDADSGCEGGEGDALHLPLSLAVGSELVDDAIGDAVVRDAVAVAPGSEPEAAQLLRELTGHGRVGLVVLGDGSARRTTAAPGYLDERSPGFDDAVADALRMGDAYALEDLDPSLAADLLAAGAPAWRAAGGALRNMRFDADLLAYEAPFGVAYFVATWLTRA